MSEKEITAKQMEMGNAFREELRRHIDHEHLDRAERILNETLEQLPGGPTIHDERSYREAMKLMEKHPSWHHLPSNKREAFTTAIQKRIGIYKEED